MILVQKNCSLIEVKVQKNCLQKFEFETNCSSKLLTLKIKLGSLKNRKVKKFGSKRNVGSNIKFWLKTN